MFRNLYIMTVSFMSGISACLIFTLRPLTCNTIYSPILARISPWDTLSNPRNLSLTALTTVGFHYRR